MTSALPIRSRGIPYRPEVDGLRAVAVIHVVLFHAGFPWIKAGYLGVDVFFVISGYLICSLVINELHLGHFSFSQFFERRARRILPALVCMTVLSAFVAWFLLLPQHLEEFSQSGVAALTFWSNIFFWRHSGYFDVEAELKPLLHTWSLSVEEQFYLIFPFFACVIFRWGWRWMFSFFFVVTLVSLGLASWASSNAANAGFYLLPTRGWELGVGVLIALLQSRDRRFGKAGERVAEFLAVVGVVTVLLSFFMSSHLERLYLVIMAVFGTTFVLVFSTSKSSVARLLGAKPLVGIGLMSYSVYLWHQPVLSLMRHYFVGQPRGWVIVIAVICTFVLSYASWRFIELPFRRQSSVGGASLAAFLCSAYLLVCGFAFAAHQTDGFGYRLTPEGQRIIKAASDKSEFASVCQAGPDNPRSPRDGCVYGNRENIKFAILGDSHGTAMTVAFAELVSERNQGLIQLTFSGCPPVGMVIRVDEANGRRCGEFNAQVRQFLAKTPEISDVVLVARWPLYLHKSRFDNGEGGVELGFSASLEWPTKLGIQPSHSYTHIVLDRYADSVKDLLAQGKRVHIVYPVPEMGWNVPSFLAKQLLVHQRLDKWSGSVDESTYRARAEAVIGLFDDLSRLPNVFPIRVGEALCGESKERRCLAHRNGNALYYDDDHPSLYGSRWVLRKLVDAGDINF